MPPRRSSVTNFRLRGKLTDDDVAMLEGSLPEEAKYLNLIDTISATSGGMNDFNLINMQDEVNWEKAIQRRLLDEQVDNEQPNYFRSENMGLTQYVGSAGGSSQGTPVSYGGIALPESDVASLVATDNPMDATIGTVMGTMGAETALPRKKSKRPAARQRGRAAAAARAPCAGPLAKPRSGNGSRVQPTPQNAAGIVESHEF